MQAFGTAASGGGVALSGQAAHGLEMQVDPVAVFIAASSDARKRAMQSDAAATALEDTPDRTSSEDEQRPLYADPGLPPIMPVKAVAKAAAKQPEAATVQPREEKGLETEQLPVKTPKPPAAGLKGKAKAKAAVGKKAQASRSKPERVERRRKRKARAESSDAGISQDSARMLFRCSCQLLRSQALEYDVRAREMEDRNAAQAKEIDDWEKRVRSLKRELQQYAEELGEQPVESTGMALIEANSGVAAAAAAATTRAAEERNLLTTAVASTPTAELGAGEAVDASLPPAVVAAEARLQEELRQRTQKVDEFCRSVPGFLHSLDEQLPRRL
ncbi:uncharacterized protein IUM83_18799 [Phytophthora cinnamomi]|uniref:uncharacterized protein n=1 Tax=Phytophthora cinnamomi TaxID=4785 RepID=UPI0035597DDA|nr:hypothetical protein IUM83_18799 [Phytophthora cinnamomi]